MPQTVTEVYDGVLGKKHRIIAMYQDTYRPIFWFQVCQDGSIYCAPDLTVNEERTIYTGITKTDAMGVLTFDFDQIETAATKVDPMTLESFKTSFHGSGVINTLGGRVYRHSIRQTSCQEELCIVFFAHPTKFKEIHVARKTDIPLRFLLDDDYPLALQISISAPSCTTFGNYPNERNDSINMLFEYKGIAEIDKLSLQLSFGMPSKGNWPKLSLIAFRTEEE
ncbi:MAG: hypothetical protein EOM51_09860 [Clostridia bacterium]|nr:hypothetical protein [Clostridia bacterium]